MRAHNIAFFLATLALLFSLAISNGALASVMPGGRGVLFGTDHAFAVTAPPGWVLDNESAVQQGLFMTFYPEGYTWNNSPVIVYGQVGKGNAQQQVAKTVREFHDNGSPDYRSQAGTPLKMPDGQEAQVYFFEGDKWGNYEAGIYFGEKETLNFLIYSARDKTHFHQYWPQFQRLAQSYENVYSHIHPVSPAQFKAMHIAADKVSKSAEGSRYETDDMESIGPDISNGMEACSGFLHDDMQNFHLLAQVQANGNSGDIYIFPKNAAAVCFSAQMLGVQHLKHQFTPNYPLVIDMKFRP